MSVQLEIKFLDNDTVVHHFTRATSRPERESIQKMIDTAMGWLQAYAGALSDEQWHHDVNRAKEAQHRE